MAYKDGVWQEENASVADRVNSLTAKDSAFMRQATSAGERAANRRGVLNSSIGIGAGISAALGAAAPIASQDAQQAHAGNMAAMSDKLSRDTTTAQIAAQDRANYASQMVNAGGNYNSGIANTLTNDKIPANTRNAVQADMAAQYRAQQQSLANIYGVKLNWS